MAPCVGVAALLLANVPNVPVVIGELAVHPFDKCQDLAELTAKLASYLS